MKTLIRVLPAAATALLLAACGGGGGGAVDTTPPPAATEVPASALASATAYSQFAASLPASETATPLGVNGVSTAPTSETEAPLGL